MQNASGRSREIKEALSPCGNSELSDIGHHPVALQHREAERGQSIFHLSRFHHGSITYALSRVEMLDVNRRRDIHILQARRLYYTWLQVI